MVTYRCEMRGATVLRRSGWSPELLPAGMQIAVEAGPDRNDPRSCYVNTLTLPDGTRLDRYSQLATSPESSGQRARLLRLPGGEPNISGTWAQEQYVMTDPGGRSGGLVPLSEASLYEPGDSAGMMSLDNGRALLFELYQVVVGARGLNLGPWMEHGVIELTPAGRAALLTPDDVDRASICSDTSIIDGWLAESIVNRITQNDDRITIEFGQTGAMRTIHMDINAHPAGIEPSRLGHSIGRWENDTLVVDTIGFTPGGLITGVANSEELHVVERYRVDPESMELIRDYVVEDSKMLAQPYVSRDVVLPSASPYVVDECIDTTTIDFSAQSGRARQ
jgi:hypothetical protein